MVQVPFSKAGLSEIIVIYQKNKQKITFTVNKN